MPRKNGVPVMFFFDKVVPRAESNKVSIVSRGRNGYGTCAADVSVTQLVGEALELVSVKVVVIPKYVVVARTARALRNRSLNSIQFLVGPNSAT